MQEGKTIDILYLLPCNEIKAKNQTLKLKMSKVLVVKMKLTHALKSVGLFGTFKGFLPILYLTVERFSI